MKFISKPKKVNAVRLLRMRDHNGKPVWSDEPRWLKLLCKSRRIAKSTWTNSMYLDTDHPDGLLNQGEWLVKKGFRLSILDNRTFKATYEPI